MVIVTQTSCRCSQGSTDAESEDCSGGIHLGNKNVVKRRYAEGELKLVVCNETVDRSWMKKTD